MICLKYCIGLNNLVTAFFKKTIITNQHKTNKKSYNPSICSLRIYKIFYYPPNKTNNKQTIINPSTMEFSVQELQRQPSQQPLNPKHYIEEDSGFKGWENDSVVGENNTNLLRNFKSQLLIYEQKYKRLDSNKTVPIMLPALEYLKHKKYTSLNNHKKSNSHTLPPQQTVLTQRKNLQSAHTQNLYKHKSIELGKKTSLTKQPSRLTSQKARQKQTHTIEQAEQKNQPILITKVQQMKFSQNQKRVRKRDLYLAIFGQRGKGKVQKIEFDDQNKAYQCYLERKNQQAKTSTVTNPTIELQKSKIRCSTQLNNRNPPTKFEPTSLSMNITSKNTSHLPIRY